MWLAVEDVIQPKWTEDIHDEWMRNVLINRNDLTRKNLERTRRLMDQYAGDCLVVGYEKHIADLILPDSDDRHVLAAGIEAGADLIVTWNLKDFPDDVVSAHGITIQTPDELICELIENNAENVIAAIESSRMSLKNPPFDSNEYRGLLQRQGLVKSVEVLGKRG